MVKGLNTVSDWLMVMHPHPILSVVIVAYPAASCQIYFNL